jgi:hypothetical protein
MTTMKLKTFHYILILILVFIPIDSFARGKSGTYFLTGLVISKTGDTLKNQMILMYFKDNVDTLLTDSNGYYQTKINWTIACPSGRTLWQRRRSNKRHNPNYIYFSRKDTMIKIKNDWKSFIQTDISNNDNNTKKENLIF